MTATERSVLMALLGHIDSISLAWTMQNKDDNDKLKPDNNYSPLVLAIQCQSVHHNG